MRAPTLRHIVGTRVVDALPPRVGIPARARFGQRDPEAALLHQFVGRGGEAVDVGAHKGAYTWHLARLVGATGRVHAFEPQPDLARRLRRGLPGVDVHCVALSDRAGQATLRVPIWGHEHMTGHATLEPHAEHHETLEVATRPLDDFDTAPSLIKVDAEGHELAVLEGATRTVDAHRPVLLLEVDYRHAPGRRAALLRWLAQRRYVAHYVTDQGRMAPLALPDVDPNPISGVARYVFNWFFVPAD